jgi:hypothetical protein
MLVTAAGALLAAACFAIGGTETGIGATVGASLAVVNLVVLRWLVGKILGGKRKATRATASALLLGKLGVLATLVWLLVVWVGVDALGFAVGLGALVIGGAAGAAPLLQGATEPAEEEG